VGEVIYKTIQDTTPSALQRGVVLGYMICWIGHWPWPPCCWRRWWH